MNTKKTILIILINSVLILYSILITFFISLESTHAAVIPGRSELTVTVVQSTEGFSLTDGSPHLNTPSPANILTATIDCCKYERSPGQIHSSLTRR